MTLVEREPVTVETLVALRVFAWMAVAVLGSQALLYLGLALFGWVLELIGT